MLTLCIPTLTRYDLLKTCIKSAENGNVKPDKYLVIDNGSRLDFKHPKVEVVSFGRNIGVAAAWNYFIQNSDDNRIICNDDIAFYPDSIEELMKYHTEDVITCSNGLTTNAFSLFVISNFIIDKVGLFDETISPNYAYYEDNDYYRRMQLLGYNLNKVKACNVGHYSSATLKSYNSQQTREHHMRFNIATENYVKKWGGLPGKEIYTVPYNGKTI